MGIVISDNLVAAFQGAEDASAFAPRIGWRDVWRTGTVTASSETQPATLTQNGLTYDGWVGTGSGDHWIACSTVEGPIDYLAIAAHELQNCAIVPQRLVGENWVNMTPEVTIANRGPVVWYFTPQSAPAYRLRLSGATSSPAIGVIMAGRATVPASGLPYGWQPPSLNQIVEGTNVISEGGQLLGRNIRRRGGRATCSLEGISYPWARTQWEAFLQHAHRRGFFMWWSYESFFEVIYGGMTSQNAAFTEYNILELSMTMEGVAHGADGSRGGGGHLIGGVAPYDPEMTWSEAGMVWDNDKMEWVSG